MDRQTDEQMDKSNTYCPFPYCRGHNNNNNNKNIIVVCICFQVVIPQLLYEFASSFLLAAGTRHASHCEAAVAVLKQLMPNWQSVTDQLTTGW